MSVFLCFHIRRLRSQETGIQTRKTTVRDKMTGSSDSGESPRNSQGESFKPVTLRYKCKCTCSPFLWGCPRPAHVGSESTLNFHQLPHTHVWVCECVCVCLRCGNENRASEALERLYLFFIFWLPSFYFN